MRAQRKTRETTAAKETTAYLVSSTGIAGAAMMLGLLMWQDAHAELKSLDDESMSEVVGQAYIRVDQYKNPENESINYVRTDLGMDIELQVNADVMELGRYPRWDEKRNDWEEQPSDILIEDYAMGHIYSEQYYTLNPLMPKPTKPDGSAYQDGEIVPFRITDPYIEFAFEEINGKKTPVGLRIGFGEAEGAMSGNIHSLTGRIDALVRTNLNYVANQVGSCELAPELCAALALQPLLGEVEVSDPAHLVYGEGTTPAHLVGEIDDARAMFTGMENGETLDASVGLVSVGVPAQNCMAAAADVCFPLSQYQTLWIGARDENGNANGAAPGAFLSFQTKPMQWNEDYHDGNLAENYMNVVQGAFLNVPAGVLEMDSVSATLGTNRVRTEYIDRGVGLF